MRVAVIGSGIAGLSAAHALNGQAAVTLYEAGAHFGGHAHTVDLTLDGVTHGVDTGFLVFNHKTYPGLRGLFADLGVATAPSEMSFSVQARQRDGSPLEWSGTNLDSVFSQRGNLLRPRFWRMLTDLMRFNALATRLVGESDSSPEPLGEFLARHRFTDEFRDWYLLPMVACIWSCPTDQMLRFPAATLFRFCHNHGLLQIADRPQWYTVTGGSREYVKRIVSALADARLSSPVQRVDRTAAGVVVHTAHRAEVFDHVIVATHPDQALKMLDAPSVAEREVLGAIRYQPNRAVLHTDESMLPRHRRAWAAWNYEGQPGANGGAGRVCLHYLINTLQPLPWTRPVIVSLNPLREIARDRIAAEIDYAHPVFDARAVQAQQELPGIQGVARTWYCGAWTKYGFHEDGYASGVAAARAVLETSRPQRSAAQSQGALA